MMGSAAPEIVPEETDFGMRVYMVRKAGDLETHARGLPSVQIRDGPARAVFPALLTASASPAWKGGAVNLANWTTADIKSEADNGWRGSNFAGWSNPDYDRLWEAYNSTLEPAERTRQIIEMARIISEELPIVSLYWIRTSRPTWRRCTGPIRTPWTPW
ncbi:MAG TPA: hypothetical protein VFC51_11040 [Chloroflexota bacterium]|nr:hypothetical protein [Chloroflexota bacterium]